MNRQEFDSRIDKEAYKSESDRDYGNSLEERTDAFKAGANFSQALTIQIVLEWLRDEAKDCRKNVKQCHGFISLARKYDDMADYIQERWNKEFKG